MSGLDLIVPLFDAKRQFYALSKLVLIRRYASYKLTEAPPILWQSHETIASDGEAGPETTKNRFVEFDRLDSTLRGGHKLGL